MLILTVFVVSITLSVLLCWLFADYGKALFVAKPRDWTPDRHHQTKQGIPTMGGIVLLGLWLLITVSGYGYMDEGFWLLIPALWTIISFGTLGAYDDWSKIMCTGGISAKTKFIAQNLAAAIAVGLWHWLNPLTAGYLWIPLFDIQLPLGFLIIPWGSFVIISASNAINLTDGLDGLAGTVLALCFAAIGLIFGIFDASIMLGALVATGVFLGFLCLNWHPARLFMGDTGALAFGALLGLYAIQLNITLLLPFIAIVPVLETASVMLQVGWFKWYNTRLFKMAPIHHHFELEGYSEHAIVLGAAMMTLGGIITALVLI